MDKDRPSDEEELWTRALLKESDRGCVIFGAEVLNEYLEQLLRSFLRDDQPSVVDPLFQTYGPLASFSARIRLCFSLKLITKDLRHRLEIVRKMRNIFAHDWRPIDFEETQLKELLEDLIGPPSGQKDLVEDQTMPGFGFTREQLVRRLAFALSLSRMVGKLESYTRFARQGKDIRTIVMLAEERDKDELDLS